MKLSPGILGWFFGFAASVGASLILIPAMGKPAGMMVGSACAFALAFMVVEFRQFPRQLSDKNSYAFVNQAYVSPGIFAMIGALFLIDGTGQITIYQSFALMFPGLILNVAISRILIRISFTREQIKEFGKPFNVANLVLPKQM